MSDQDLRELERRFRETGSVEDEVRLLSERLRGGSLKQSDVELAAYLGHPASQLIAPGVIAASGDLSAWTRGLAKFGDTVVVYAAHACARVALPRLAPQPQAFEAAEAALRASRGHVQAPK